MSKLESNTLQLNLGSFIANGGVFYAYTLFEFGSVFLRDVLDKRKEGCVSGKFSLILRIVISMFIF